MPPKNNKPSTARRPPIPEKYADLAQELGPSPIKVEDRTCAACSRVCTSRNQLNHHYAGCAEFLVKYPRMKPEDRNWHMTLAYVFNKPELMGRICIGCGLVAENRDALHRHFLKCSRAADVDQKQRLTLFGFLEGTPHDDSAAHLRNYKDYEKQSVPIVSTRHYVEKLKERMKKEATVKAEKKATEPCACVKCAYTYLEPPIPHESLASANQQEGYLVIPIVMAGYGTVMNGRNVYVPQQQIYVRIHDRGLAQVSTEAQPEQSM
jgi:hypothetical protein